MDKIVNIDEWADFFPKFNKINMSRATCLREFDKMGAQTVEHGLPLGGLDLQKTGEGSPIVEIMLGGQKPGQKHLTHSVSNVRMVYIILYKFIRNFLSYICCTFILNPYIHLLFFQIDSQRKS